MQPDGMLMKGRTLGKTGDKTGDVSGFQVFKVPMAVDHE